MKKLLSLMLVVLVASLFAACGDDNGDKCEGTGAIGDACSDKCPCSAGTCTDGVCVEDSDDCCPGEGDLFVSVSGMAVDLTTKSGVASDLAALSPVAALSGDFTHLAEATAAADGTFMFECFDADNIALGLVLLADDTGYDGADGTYYPTISGIASWPNDAAKDCEEGATAMMIPNTLLAGLQQAIPEIDLEQKGMILGTVLDASRAPIEGATVEREDGEDVTVYYPTADFSGMGAATSSNGVYIIIEGFGGVKPLIGVATDYTWASGTFLANTIGGAVYFVPLVANE